MRASWGIVGAAWLGLAAAALAEDAAARLAAAREHLQRGRYAEARQAFAQLAETLPAAGRTPVLVGLCDSYVAVGEYDRARSLLETEVQLRPDEGELWGKLAELQFACGDWEAARRSAEQGLRRDTDALRCRLILAHLHREAGELDEALEGYRWFVRYYNRAQPRDAPSLRLVAEGSLEYARWKRVSSVFHFVVNTLCPDALRDDPADWRTMLLSGELLLEKYNPSQAIPEFEAALAVNPAAAEVHAALARAALMNLELDQARQLADRALAVNPRLLSALLVRAEVEIAAEDPAAAEPFVAQALAVNPRDQQALALRAVSLLMAERLPDRETLQAVLRVDETTAPRLAPLPPGHALPSEFTQLLADLARRNPRPGVFLNRLGEFFESQRKSPQAELCYRAAAAVMPQLPAPTTNLGLLYMRTGRLSEAEAMLAEAFRADPFHVRVSNMRKVLEVLQGYETIRTEHFLVRVDASDRRLGEAMAEYLEEVHEELTAQLGFTPPPPTQFEVYHAAKGQTAHQWFSARMVGLPWIQTIGASTGQIVALASPSAVDKPFHWGRVLRHEYVHILTLQQTDFNIPHWYTEALAVRAEGLVLPEAWKRLLVQRLAQGDLYTLRTIHEGFRRPRTPDDWTLAYCQSRQYARFLEERWGFAALQRLLAAYRDGLRTEAAIATVCGLTYDEFEREYRAWLERLVEDIVRGEAAPQIDLKAAQADFRAHPQQPSAIGRYAYAVWQQGEAEEARSLAQEARRLDPREPFATAVLVHLAEQDQDDAQAARLLADAFDPAQPHPVLLALAAERLFHAGAFAQAEELYRLGTERFRWEETFWKGLAAACLRQGAEDRAVPALTELAHRDGENLAVRRKLAQSARARGDGEALQLWAREVLFLDFEDAEAHAWLGEAAAARQQTHRARVAFETALQFDERCVTARLGLARLERRLGRIPEAQAQVRAALQADPENSEAAALERELAQDQTPP